jgi:hypothetical protein
VPLSEVLEELKKSGVSASAAKVRFAITAGHVSRPPLDGSLRFNFSDKNFAELFEYFHSRSGGKVAAVR